MPIVSLAQRHEAALQRFVRDFEEAGETHIPGLFPSPGQSHGATVTQLSAWERSEGLQPGWVPCSTRFMEVDDELVGVVNVRHALNDGLKLRGGHVGYSVAPSHRGRGHAKAMLSWALDHCASLGIPEALVTTDQANFPSQRVVLACGGVLERTAVHPGDGETVCHFRVPTGLKTPCGPA